MKPLYVVCLLYNLCWLILSSGDEIAEKIGLEKTTNTQEVALIEIYKATVTLSIFSGE